MPSSRRANPTFPAGPAVLIAVGVLFLLHNLDILRFCTDDCDIGPLP